MASSVMYFPEGQLVQLAETAEEYFPAGQMLQVALPSCSENEPASHSKQAVRPTWREAVVASSVMYFPDGQERHGEVVEVEYFPNEQMVQVTLPCSENAPASQSKQSSSADPGDELESMLS